MSDIIESIGRIESFMKGISTYEEYSKDYKTQSAIERQLGIIGEAVNQFEKLSLESGQSIYNARQIISFRNRIIHGYDTVDNTIVWTIIKRYIKPLKGEAIDKLNS